jgi:hypothetical protein
LLASAHPGFPFLAGVDKRGALGLLGTLQIGLAEHVMVECKRTTKYSCIGSSACTASVPWALHLLKLTGDEGVRMLGQFCKSLRRNAAGVDAAVAALRQHLGVQPSDNLLDTLYVRHVCSPCGRWQYNTYRFAQSPTNSSAAAAASSSGTR